MPLTPIPTPYPPRLRSHSAESIPNFDLVYLSPGSAAT